MSLATEKAGKGAMLRRMVICIFTGFASGMPLYLLLNLVPAWLRNEDVPLVIVGLFTLAQFPFTWKFLWAPLLDRYNVISWLGRRRSWMLLSQIGLLASIAWLGQVVIPGQGFPWVAFMLACVIAFLSATQDIALDAFRREILPDAELGLGNAIHVNAYRIAGLVPGSLSLILADKLPWEEVFAITAIFMLPGLVMTLMVKEPATSKTAPRTLRAAVVEPFVEFFGRHGVKSALLVLAFIFLYKVGDSLGTALATPFYLDMGFSMSEIGIVAKNAGLWTSVIGGILGGIWMIKLGINRALWVFGVIQSLSAITFATLAWMGPPYVAPKEYVGLAPEAFVEFVTRDVFAHACANREILAENPRNAHTLVSSSARRYFNFTRMATKAAGYDSREISDKERRSLTRLGDAFRTQIVRDWAGSVFQHCDWTVEINPARLDGDGKDVTVSAVLRQGDEEAITVNFALEKRSTQKVSPFAMLLSFLRDKEEGAVKEEDPKERAWRVFDITVDGQSLVASYLAVFADKLHAVPAETDDPETAGLESLIEWIKSQHTTDFMAILALALVVGFEALGVGLGTVAFVAFMARTTHPAYVATQLALFTSLMAVPRTIVNASAGWLVESLGGWTLFFWFCFFISIPGMLLLFKVAPWGGQGSGPADGD